MSRDFRSDRRAMLKAGGAALVTGALAGCTADGRDGPGGAATTGTERTTTGRETDIATALYLPIEVGPDGRLAFEPSGDRPLVIEPDTEVPFVWRSDNHNVVVDDQPDDADWAGTPGDAETFYDEGYEYSHTFEKRGTYEFHCEAHAAAGMKGTVEVREEVPSPEFASEDDLPVRVGPDGELRFSPGTDRPLKVSAGTEVRFVWESDSHNVVVDDRPQGANWRGTPGRSSAVYDEGYEYNHTFDVPGVYRFHCHPHETVGMTGTIVVEAE
ncbi:plastocyanin/azurin family copper-binding protein [Halorussus sp. AFM4]|uniref:plastocyanin/azurin family copper-binding protein n=1 Tax=Halorussus sp. AFM4 TaxID=3421651 RepID=UPI003EB8489C